MITWSISLARPFFGEVDVPFILSLLDGPGWVVWPGLNIAALGFSFAVKSKESIQDVWKLSFIFSPASSREGRF